MLRPLVFACLLSVSLSMLGTGTPTSARTGSMAMWQLPWHDIPTAKTDARRIINEGEWRPLSISEYSTTNGETWNSEHQKTITYTSWGAIRSTQVITNHEMTYFEEYEYDSNRQLVKKSQYINTPAGREYTEIRTYAYDPVVTDFCIRETVDNFDGAPRTVYEYAITRNASGTVTSSTYKEADVYNGGGDLVLTRRTTYTLNEQGVINGATIEYWDTYGKDEQGNYPLVEVVKLSDIVWHTYDGQPLLSLMAFDGTNGVASYHMIYSTEDGSTLEADMTAVYSGRNVTSSLTGKINKTSDYNSSWSYTYGDFGSVTSSREITITANGVANTNSSSREVEYDRFGLCLKDIERYVYSNASVDYGFESTVDYDAASEFPSTQIVSSYETHYSDGVTGETKLEPKTKYVYGQFERVTDAVQNVSADINAPVEYFSLDGRRADNPTAGIYIRRQASNVSKVIM